VHLDGIILLTLAVWWASLFYLLEAYRQSAYSSRFEDGCITMVLVTMAISEGQMADGRCYNQRDFAT
jgi:hypothetical protein